MEKEKLILSINNNKFYLSIPNEIEIGEYDYFGGCITINNIYKNLFSDKMLSITRNSKEYCFFNFNDKVNLFLLNDSKYIIPKGVFELGVTVFSRLKSCLKKYEDIFEVEFREFYTKDGNDISGYKVSIDYEMIKLENPIKKKNYLFRLKDNNIPKNWVEQSEYLIKRLENLNSKYGNISQNKINLIDFEGCIPKNIDFVINEEYAKRLDDLFKSWNDGNKKSKRMKLVEYLFNIYENDVTSNKEYYSIKVDERITLLVDVEKLEILEFKTMYHNIDISSYYKLSECVKNIQKEIDNIKLS